MLSTQTMYNTSYKNKCEIWKLTRSLKKKFRVTKKKAMQGIKRNQLSMIVGVYQWQNLLTNFFKLKEKKN